MKEGFGEGVGAEEGAPSSIQMRKKHRLKKKNRTTINAQSFPLSIIFTNISFEI